MDAHQEFDLDKEDTHKGSQTRGTIARKLYAGVRRPDWNHCADMSHGLLSASEN